MFWALSTVYLTAVPCSLLLLNKISSHVYSVTGLSIHLLMDGGWFSGSYLFAFWIVLLCTLCTFPCSGLQSPFWNLGHRQWFLEYKLIQFLPVSGFLECNLRPKIYWSLRATLCHICFAIIEFLTESFALWIPVTGPTFSRAVDRMRYTENGGEVFKIMIFKEYPH